MFHTFKHFQIAYLLAERNRFPAEGEQNEVSVSRSERDLTAQLVKVGSFQ